LEYAESLFLIFYSVEVMVRFLSFAKVVWCLDDFWFGYDMVLIILMWMEVLLDYIGLLATLEDKGGAEFFLPWLSAYRLARVVRVMRAMPSVVTVLLGISSALKSVMSTFYILGFELFWMAIIFRARFGGPPYDGPKETEEEFFDRTGDDDLIYNYRSANESCFTCLFVGVFCDGLSRMMAELSRKSYPMMVLFLVHVILTNLTLLNVLVGVVCTVIQEATDSQEDRRQMKVLQKIMLKHIQDVDKNRDEKIGPSEFFELLKIPEVVAFLLDECSIDPRHMLVVGETIFHDRTNPGQPKELSYNDLLRAIFNLWGGKPTKISDFLMLQQEVRASSTTLHELSALLKEQVRTKELSVNLAEPLATPATNGAQGAQLSEGRDNLSVPLPTGGPAPLPPATLPGVCDHLIGELDSANATAAAQ
jgi:hypothetical protein